MFSDANGTLGNGKVYQKPNEDKSQVNPKRNTHESNKFNHIIKIDTKPKPNISKEFAVLDSHIRTSVPPFQVYNS